jgi:hypothetical protein
MCRSPRHRVFARAFGRKAVRSPRGPRETRGAGSHVGTGDERTWAIGFSVDLTNPATRSVHAIADVRAMVAARRRPWRHCFPARQSPAPHKVPTWELPPELSRIAGALSAIRFMADRRIRSTGAALTRTGNAHAAGVGHAAASACDRNGLEAPVSSHVGTRNYHDPRSVQPPRARRATSGGARPRRPRAWRAGPSTRRPGLSS